MIDEAKKSLKVVDDHKAVRDKKIELPKQKIEKGFLLEIRHNKELIVIVTLGEVSVEFTQKHSIRFVEPKNTTSQKQKYKRQLQPA